MLPNRMFLPALSTELRAVGALAPEPELLTELALEARGVPMRRAGWSWAPARASVVFAPLAEGEARSEPVAFEANLALQRRAGESNPVVAASDTRIGGLRLGRDHRLGVDLDGSFVVADWAGGLYLPALFPRDLEARVVVGARALGVRWRRFDTRGLAQPADFWGMALGGLSGEFVYGRKLGAAVLTGRAGGQVDWSAGSNGAPVLLTDTEIWLGGALELGEHHALRLTLARAVESDPPHRAAFPSLALAWRTTW